MARNLKKGKKGDDVKQLQRDLQAVGYYLTGKIDGKFGKLTDKAVRAFQKANKLKVDGVVGPKTRAALAAKKNAKKRHKKTVVNTVPSKYKSVTVETGRFHGKTFSVGPDRIFSFSDLTAKGSSELETSSKEKPSGYVKRKGANPMEVTFKVHLNAFAGCDVRGIASSFVMWAGYGWKDYFYVGGKKLLPCQFMLVEASVKDTQINHKGEWTRATVTVTMKQCEKSSHTKEWLKTLYPGSTKSAKTSIKFITGPSSTAAQPYKKAVKTGTSSIRKLQKTAKKISSKKKKVVATKKTAKAANKKKK